ncbi:MAG: SGNH/GDSL hydrolase family protein [Verrucomicrobia bacterium]|nr:SGNH/GDSL hydrolase family protein [Verrucomicrobiota bacterium]
MSKIALPLFATVLSLVFVELGTRIFFNRNGMHYGIEMWKYAKQMKRRNGIPKMGHEHIPNEEARLMGTDVKINSQGLRDHEYPISKDESTFRILVLGDSMTFGWGAEFDATYPKVLEQMLNDEQKDSSAFQRYEVINAGVGNYNTVQEVTYFKERGIQYNPDMVLLGFYLNDAEEIPKRSHGFFREHSYFYVLLSSGWDALLRGFGKRQGYKDYYLGLYAETNPGWKDCQAALKELIQLCQEKDIQLRIVIIPELHHPNENYAFGKVHTLIKNIGSRYHIPVIDLLPAFEGEHPPSLWVSRGDPHPSVKAHLIIAKEIYDKTWKFARE